jgi:hypothetical protein
MHKKPVVMNLVVTLGLVSILLAVTEPIFASLHNFAFREIEADFLEPLFFATIFVIPTSVFLLFFNQTIQLKWWHWARWMMLVSIPVILTGTTTGYAWLRRTDLAVLCGSVLLGSTIVYALIQRFYYKTGLNK